MGSDGCIFCKVVAGEIPADVVWETPPDRRTLDARRIDGPITPADQFFTIQHYGHPTVDAATFKLGVSGLVFIVGRRTLVRDLEAVTP